MAEDCWEARMAAKAQERQLVREAEEWLEHRAAVRVMADSLGLLIMDDEHDGERSLKAYVMNEFGQWEEIVPRIVGDGE